MEGLRTWCFACVLLLASGASSLRLEKFALMTDYSNFFDAIVDEVVSSQPAFLPLAALNLGLTQQGPKPATLGQLTSSSATVGDIRTLKRSSNVTSEVGVGNMTLAASLAFGSLTLDYAQAQLQILGVSFDIAVLVNVSRNSFYLRFVLYTAKNGSCAVDLQSAQFTTLTGVSISVTPEGFFNQLKMNATINQLSQTILSTFNDFNKNALQSALQAKVCSLVPA